MQKMELNVVTESLIKARNESQRLLLQLQMQQKRQYNHYQREEDRQNNHSNSNGNGNDDSNGNGNGKNKKRKKETHSKDEYERETLPNTVHSAVFENECVVVKGSLLNKMAVFNLGYYGKGSFSRGAPEAVSTVAAPLPSEDLCLLLEEAFFLVWALGVLVVRDINGVPIAVGDLWRLFQGIKPQFASTYFAYHHFRRRGWIPKSGLKYGVDFVVYKDGPMYVHAEFAVVVRRVSEDLQQLHPSSRQLPWSLILNLNRVQEQVGKNFCIAYLRCNDDEKTCKEIEKSPDFLFQHARICTVKFDRSFSEREKT